MSDVQAKLDAGFKKLQAANDCKSLLKKYLTKEVFQALKGDFLCVYFCFLLLIELV